MNRTPRLYKSAPSNYPHCIHTDCPMADTCLHQLAFRRHEGQGKYLRLINPSLCTKQKNCPHYADSQPVTFAKGFTNFQKRMYPDQYDKFMSQLIMYFGRNQYFHRRRGDVLLSPQDQLVVRQALTHSGVTQQMDFDEYIEAINWNSK